MANDPVETNYNDTGTIVMEMIYGADFLSPGGLEMTQSLVELADIKPGSRVLDIGCGLGGAVFYLAEHKACTVTGIDLMPENIVAANRRAREKHLTGSTHFEVGDAHAVPCSAASFDVVWGQDAWCHVDDKKRLLREAQRVLDDSGLVVFSDWLLVDEEAPHNDEIRKVTASANMASEESYQTHLSAAGFELLEYVDTSKQISQRYRRVLERLHAFEAEISVRFSTKVFEIIRSKQQFVLDAFSEDRLGTGSFLARKITG